MSRISCFLPHCCTQVQHVSHVSRHEQQQYLQHLMECLDSKSGPCVRNNQCEKTHGHAQGVPIKVFS